MKLPHRVALLVFDLDGTLADTRADLVSAVQSTLDFFQATPASASEIERHIGTGVQSFLSQRLAATPDVAVDRAMQFYKDFYLRNFANKTKLYEGVEEVLRYYHGRIPMVVLTNKSQDFAKPLLDRLGVSSYFEGIYGAEAFPTRKPDPATLRDLCQLHQTRTQDSVLIGDTPVDMLCAQRAGAPSCAALYGFSAKDELIALRPSWAIQSPRELLSMFEATGAHDAH